MTGKWLESTQKHLSHYSWRKSKTIMVLSGVSLSKGRSNICHPATKLPSLQTASQAQTFAPGGSLASIVSKLPEWVCLFYLWQMPCACSCTGSPALRTLFPARWCIISCPVWWLRPSPLCTNTRNIQMNPPTMIGGKRCKRERALWDQEIMRDSFNGSSAVWRHQRDDAVQTLRPGWLRTEESGPWDWTSTPFCFRGCAFRQWLHHDITSELSKICHLNASLNYFCPRTHTSLTVCLQLLRFPEIFGIVVQNSVCCLSLCSHDKRSRTPQLLHVPTVDGSLEPMLLLDPVTSWPYLFIP